MNEQYDVCAIGNAIVDVIAAADDAFLTREGIAKGGMTLIDAARAETLYAKMGQATEVSGGSAANTAAGVASFGGKPAYIGKVRNDQLGNIFRHDMTAIGVHYSTPPATQGPATARCLIAVTPDAQRSMSTYLGACVEFGPADLQPELIKAAQITYLEGYLFDKPEAKDAFRQAAQVARAADRKLSLTLSDTFCVERHKAAFHIFVNEAVDILFANENELKALYEAQTFELALQAARQKCPLVVATRSEKGAVIAAGAETVAIAAEPVTKVVDTTGAGDLFAAGFLFGMSQHKGLAQSGRLGAIAAAEVISHVGPRPQTNLAKLATEKMQRAA